MNHERAFSINCLPSPLQQHAGTRHFLGGVLIGAAVLIVVFALV